MKYLLLTLVLLSLSGFTVHDGDTVTKISYRLAYIDAPELDQTWHTNNTEITIGKLSQAYLQAISLKRMNQCYIVSMDRYGRFMVVSQFEI